MSDQETKDLLDRVERGDCTPEEKALVEDWYLELCRQQEPVAYNVDYSRIKKEIWHKLKIGNGKSPDAWYLMAAAIVFMSVLSYTRYMQQHTRVPVQEKLMAAIRPGSNKATLTLSDGSRINLDEAGDAINAAPGITAQKNKKGSLNYYITTRQPLKLSEDQPVYNTITTPRGGQYQVVLPDGSRVFLNAESSITFPVPFTRSIRRVQLNGEAYFEVAKNRQQPFVVSSQKQNIKVTGTHFNVCCYLNQPDITTLAEGSVEISPLHSSATRPLKPGQQAILTENKFEVKEVDTDDATAWKDGLFVFNGTPIKEVLKQIGRWYDVDFSDSNLPNRRFDAEIPRSLNLLQVIRIIEVSSKLKFRIDGRKVTVQ
ncbi:FecR family protein [Chitinophaga flava]|uniref:Anti-sigma factor n=1 Tax=Chitinophaga flava TaxID=2259036 RepID=A0A365XSJ9_9BACT|nr:FecR domain-containing protein [Chitinophaga flava]RBL89356.1 anti-sigma factor [Chitinophaga flava]